MSFQTHPSHARTTVTRKPAITGSIALLCSLVTLSPTVFAANGTWTADLSNAWSTASNWSGGIIAGGQDSIANFNANLTADRTITVGNQTIGHLYIQDSNTSTPFSYILGASGETGTITFDVSSGIPVMNIGFFENGGGKKVAITRPLAGNDGLLKIGVGALSLRGDTSGLSGPLIIAGGAFNDARFAFGASYLQITNGSQLTLDFQNNPGTGVTNLIPATSPLILGGEVSAPPTTIPANEVNFSTTLSGRGLLQITGKASNTNSQTFSGVTLHPGAHSLNATNGTGGSMTVNLGAITRAPGASITFNPAANGTGSFTTTSVNTSGNILGGWATFGTSDWATSASDGVTPGALTASTVYHLDSWGLGMDTDVVSPAVAGSGPTHTVRFNSPVAGAITLANGSSISAGGILVSPNVATNSSAINGGSLTAETGELFVFQNNATANTSLTIASSLVDGLTPLQVHKLGAGVLALTGTNTYTGGTTLVAGTLNINSAASLGAIPAASETKLTIVANSTVQAGGTFSTGPTQDIEINDGVTATFDTQAHTMTLEGDILAGPATTLTKSGTGTLVLNGHNTSGGQITLTDGVIAIGSDTALGTGSFRFHIANKTLRSANEETRTISNPFDIAVSAIFGEPGTGDLVLNGTFTTGNAAKVLTINNATTTVNGVVTGGASTNANTKAGPGTLVFANGANTYDKPTVINEGILSLSVLANGGQNSGMGRSSNAASNLVLNGGTLRYTGTGHSTNRLFTIGVDGGTLDASGSGAVNFTNAGAVAFSGATGDRTLTLTGSSAAGNTLSASLADNGGLTSVIKHGSGTWVLAGNNSYTGTTTVTDGTLLVTGSISGSSVIVDGGILGGNGGTIGPVTVNAGGEFAPGASIGTLNVAGTLTLSGTASFEIQKLGIALTSDLTNVTGLVTFGGTLNVTASGDPLQLGDAFDLFDAPSFSGSFAALNLPALDPSLAWDTSRLTEDGTLTVVPEPASAAVLLSGLSVIAGLRRRRTA